MQEQQEQQEQQVQEQQAAAAVLEQGGEGSEGGALPEWARPYTPRKKQEPPRPATLFGRTVQEGLPAGATSGGGDGAAAAVLVAHEHAIRGIDLPQVDLVIVTMLPDSTESSHHPTPPAALPCARPTCPSRPGLSRVWAVAKGL